MKSLLCFLGLCCLSVFAQVNGKSSASAVQTAETVPVPQMRRVAVLVSATDRTGRAVQGLSKDQLSVVDNDQATQVLNVSSAGTLPLDLGIVLLSTPSNFSQQQAAAVDLVHKVLRPNMDKAFVVTAGGSKPWPNPKLEWQTDAEAITTIIQGLDKNAGLPDAVGYDASPGSSGIYNIIFSMMQSDQRPARHAVVIVRNEWARTPGTTGDAVEARRLQTIEAAQHLWTSFFVIGLKQTDSDTPAVSLGSDSNGAGNQYPSDLAPQTPTVGGDLAGRTAAGSRSNDNGSAIVDTAERAKLQRLAAETGGAIWWSSKKNFSDAVAGITGALTGQYAVTYAAPADPAAGPEHLLLVKANDASMHIAAQKVYFSRQAQPQPAASKPPQ